MWHHRAEGKGQRKGTESKQDRRRAKSERKKKKQASWRQKRKKEKCVKMTAPKIGWGLFTGEGVRSARTLSIWSVHLLCPRCYICNLLEDLSLSPLHLSFSAIHPSNHASTPSSPHGCRSLVIVLSPWLQMSLITKPDAVLDRLCQASERDVQGNFAHMHTYTHAHTNPDSLVRCSAEFKKRGRCRQISLKSAFPMGREKD